MHKYILPINGEYNYELSTLGKDIDPLFTIDGNKLMFHIYDMEHILVIATYRGDSFEVESDIINNDIKDTISRVLGVNSLYNDSLEHLMKTSISDKVNSCKGLRLIGDTNPYICLMKCIIHQLISMKASYTITLRVVDKYGGESRGVKYFPTCEVIANLAPEDLRQLGIPYKKAEYMINLSQEVLSGNLNLNEIGNLDEKEFSKLLIKYRGIGKWTVEMMMMFAYGKPNVFSISDMGIINGIKNIRNMDAKPEKEELLAVKDEVSPYGTYASVYVWSR